MTTLQHDISPERVVVINDASVAKGGATGLAMLSIRLMRARGLAVTLICGDAGEAEELADLGVEVLALGQSRLLSAGKLTAMRKGLYNAEAVALVAEYVDRRDTQGTIYHVHGWAQILSPALFQALRPVAPRVITHAHDMFLACPNGVYMDFRAGKPCERVPLSRDCWRTNCDKRAYSQKLWRCARSGRLRRSFDQRMDWGPVALIHPGMTEMLARGGVTPSRLKVVRNPAAPWTEQRIKAEDNTKLVFVGRVDQEKGVDPLAKAAAEAGVTMTFVGDGPRREPLAKAHPSFEFPGWLDAAGIGAHARSARALVMPSVHPEPFGLVAAEASMSGLPVILSQTALMAQDITSGGLGLTYDPADPAGLRTALAQMAAMEAAEVARISTRAFAQDHKIAQSPSDWIDSLLALYQTMLSRVGPEQGDNDPFAPEVANPEPEEA